MTIFSDRYKSLNHAQRQAVDTIDGPVMVIAGPGTGKTELLGMRVANILKKTDTLPQNILCLTFTESGASAMRERLVGLMGKDAYKVAIHTFHSFGTEIINQYAHYFYQGAHFRPADELDTYQILRDILDHQPHDSPLASKINGEFTQLKSIKSAISHLKKSGLTPDELLKILDHNDEFTNFAEPVLSSAFSTPRLSKKDIPQITAVRDQLASFAPASFSLATPLATVCLDELTRACEEAETTSKTTPITAWRNRWLEKDTQNVFIMKDRSRAVKLRALAHVYYEYLATMQKQSLYDFDDMILRVTHALETFDELRYNLHEQYQYILVDEFQDTSGAQMRILNNLTNNPSHEDRPNILVVGDDDQAIYSFQGAEISNILDFQQRFTPEVITLTENYRSSPSILEKSRHIITQGHDRLENHLSQLDKTLTPHHMPKKTAVTLHELPAKSDEYTWIVEQIHASIAAGHTPADIAVLTRTHNDILQILPYFHHAGIEVTYERRDNVLDMPPIQLLEKTSRAVLALAEQDFDELNALLPEVLSHPAWGIAPKTLWELGLASYKTNRFWLETMLECNDSDNLHAIAEWFVVTAATVPHAPLEHILDILTGTTPEENTAFTSPLKSYFFSENALTEHPEAYLSYLNALKTIRQKLRDWQPDTPLTLSDFTEFIDLHRKTNIGITSHRAASEQGSGVHLMTAHKAKGLEFTTVYIVNATEKAWNKPLSGGGVKVSFTTNLPITPAGDTEDERLRLFFVAMTRAKDNLHLTYAAEDLTHKNTSRASFLQTDAWETLAAAPQESAATHVQAAENQWHERIVAHNHHDLRATLAPALERYKISATHLNNFTDVVHAGPQSFLLKNLLRFPEATSPHAAFGSAIHKTLQRAHSHLSATGNRRPVEDLLQDFETALGEARLYEADFEKYLQKGSDVLQTFLYQRYDSFHEQQIVERDFMSQGVVIDGVALTGKLDLMEVDHKTRTITVTDYKTNKPLHSWTGKTDAEKIKLHKFKQQLMFYKLLVENSRDFAGYTVERGIIEFVEPAATGDIIRLEYTYSDHELAEFKKLLAAVWHHIQTLNFPGTSDFAQTYKGFIDFEKHLLDDMV